MSLKIEINNNFACIKPSYLFSDINKRVKEYLSDNPNANLIRLGIGDVTLPLIPSAVDAMKSACDEMAEATTFRGYPPEYGYDFLKDAVSGYYNSIGVCVESGSIYVSDGAKSDIGNITDLFGDVEICIPDPVYPVYLDSNLMNGRKITFVKGCTENGFLPMPDLLSEKPYVIYLCSPNNPTGAVYDRKQLSEWVDFALNTGSLIVFDAAYGAFIDNNDLPISIYEIPKADECSIEICSFSKFAGFTGVRCGWTVIPNALRCNGAELGKMWARRQATKFNGVSYITQRGAEAALSEEGLKQCRDNISYYKRNASILANVMNKSGIWYTGGIYSPYIWLECPNKMDSWKFFDMLLTEANIIGTPGEGFGECGKGFFRLSSFGSYEKTLEASQRLEEFFKGVKI